MPGLWPSWARHSTAQDLGETGVMGVKYWGGQNIAPQSSVCPSQVVEPTPGAHSSSLPAALYRLLDPSANVDLPTAQRVRQLICALAAACLVMSGHWSNSCTTSYAAAPWVRLACVILNHRGSGSACSS